MTDATAKAASTSSAPATTTVVCAFDKFRGTLTAGEACAAAARGVADAIWEVEVIEVPLADGGEGFLEVLGGGNRSTLVTGPLGDPVTAEWQLRRSRAVIEMAAASGLMLAGGAEGNDPMAASTVGTGELIAEAVALGARRILVGVGGSATTDGGLGAVRAMEPHARLHGLKIEVACDVRTRFAEAAEVFAPQKGASAAQVELLKRRLARLQQVYESDFGVDVSALEGGGAAGGLAGGLAAVGARLVGGFDLVSEELDLDTYIESADLVVTGEGLLDEASFDGKVVGGVHELAEEFGVPVVTVVGDIDADLPDRRGTVSLVDVVGEDRAFSDADGALREAVAVAVRASGVAGL